MPLHIRYRPNTLEDFIGNKQTVRSLQSMFNREKNMPHSFLFTGPSGCGKTTLARILKNHLGCADNDYREVDSADFRGIDTIRDLRKQMNLKPISGPVRVWLLDECHKMTNDAQNALLKALEDTPEHVYFILATTDPQKLLKTIKTRCTTYNVAPLADWEITGYLRRVCRMEKRSVDKEVLQQIAKDSIGSMRMALVVLDKVIHMDAEDQLEAAKQAAEEENESIELCRALLNKKPWKAVAAILKGLQQQEPESIRRVVLGYCQSVLLSGQTNEQAFIIIDCFREPLYDIGFPGLTAACYESLTG